MSGSVEWVRLALDPTTFDESPFEHDLRPLWRGPRETGRGVGRLRDDVDSPCEGIRVSEMTGVLRTHRGRGVSLALKVMAIRFAGSSGMPLLRTFHPPDNAFAIAMNRRLGFVDDRQDP